MAKERIKSAYELAMEQLEAKDRKEGVEVRKPLTETQKTEIARLREGARAKHAELEILHGKNVEGTGGDPEKLKQVQEEYEIDRRRVDSALESALARVRSGA